MAAPNIVNVATITAKTTYAALTTTLTSVLLANAASSGKVLKINTILIANIDGTNSADVTINYNTVADASGTSYGIAGAITIPAKSSLSLLDKNTSIYLEENRSIIGGASSNSRLQIIISYEELS